VGNLALAYISVKWHRYTRALERFKAARSNGANDSTLDFMKAELDAHYRAYCDVVAPEESVSPNPKQH
jgi:hypothetical protein